MSSRLLPPGFDVTAPDLIARGVPLEEFAKLRTAAPVTWNAQRRGIGGIKELPVRYAP